MKILLKKVRISDFESEFHLQTKDIFIENGIITKIADKIENADGAEVVEIDNLNVSQGWVDVFAHFCDPGGEFRETLESGANAAAAGGYTQVFTLPNTQPAVQNKTQVEYIVQKSKQLPVSVRPLAAVTKNIEGSTLAEMYDMYNSGAVAFSDGNLPIQSSGLLLKALQYVKAFDGVIIQLPVDQSIGKFGLMHEGIISTRLGLPGIPAVAEKMMIQRDIELLKYTDSKLHITGVSTAAGIGLIQKAKAEGLQITCSVTPYHLIFCDEDLITYDTNLKVNPPLRSRKDMIALREAVKNGIVDCIASHHIPQNWDNKVCEFEYAKNGMIGLQTVYATVQTAIPELSAEKISELFSLNARNIFGLPSNPIKEGGIAELTLFVSPKKFVFTKQLNQSKSENTPLFDKELNGTAVGTIHNTILH